MLLQSFGSLEALQGVSADQLERAGLPRPVAENLLRALAGNKAGPV